MFHPVTGSKRDFLAHKQDLLFAHRHLLTVQCMFCKLLQFFQSRFCIRLFQNQTFFVIFYAFHRRTDREYGNRHMHGHDLGSCIREGLRPDGRDKEQIDIFFHRQSRKFISGVSSCTGKYRTVDLFIRYTDQLHPDIQILCLDLFDHLLDNIQTFFITQHTEQTNVQCLCRLRLFIQCRHIMRFVRQYM